MEHLKLIDEVIFTNRKAILQRKAITIFLLFFIACVIGWIYEMLFYRIDTGEFIKRGQGFGPWLPIYGFGALSIVALTSKKKFSITGIFLISAVGSAIIELIAGWALFTFGNGLRLWDYNTEIWNWGNIGGYVCIRSVLLFAIMGTLFYYLIIPKVTALTSKFKLSVLTAVTLPIAIIFFTDLIIGYLIKPFFAIVG